MLFRGKNKKEKFTGGGSFHSIMSGSTLMTTIKNQDKKEKQQMKNSSLNYNLLLNYQYKRDYET